jgi:hypothetical protein
VKSAPPTRLSVEHLEERLTPTWGVSWYNPTALTLSFAADGTDVNGSPNSLHALLGPNTPVWQREILRAFQTWAVEANINIGLVADGGQGFGFSGQAQGDSRVGDIRIGARPLSQAVGAVDLAAGVGFDYSGGTWSGDVLLNSLFGFGVGDAPGQHDLFSVVLHEASHSFGFADDASDASSVFFPGYQIWTGLTPQDRAAIQSLYGVRAQDAFEGATGNNTLATAFHLTTNGNLTAISGDVTSTADVDYYQLTTPSAESGATGLTVKLRAAGLSLLTARVTVLDAQGNALDSAVTYDPLSNDLSVTLSDYDAATTYYVKVQGAGTDVFSAGAYVLRLEYTDATGAPVAQGTSLGLGSPYVNTSSAASTLATAQVLGFSSETHSTAFAAVGSINTPTDANWYQFTPTALTSFTGTLTVSVVPQDQGTSGVYARVAVFDAAGNELPAVVVTNEFGAFTVQLADQAPGTTYYVRVTSANPTGTHATGGYVLSASLVETEVTTFEDLTEATLTAATSTVYSELELDQGRLVQFSLSASTGASAPDQAVRMTIFDSAGHAVFTMAVEAGNVLATGTAWLSAGIYTVVYNAATRDGSALQDLAVSVSARERSDPMDPFYIDPIVGPPPAPPLPPPPPLTPPPPPPPPPPDNWFLVSSTSAYPLPGQTILDPIANPYLSLN